MRHLGDITKLNGAELPVVDVITGGSPCQDLSIAGRREGLAGERSGLFMDQIRIVKEMREHDRQQGRTGAAVRPRYMVWENVPGAFSSNKGQDFRAVLEEIVRVAKDPPTSQICLCLKRVGGPNQDASTTSWADGPLLGEFTTRSTGECPKEENASRLSQILEDSPPQRYFLSAKDCLGILTRANRRGKKLPPELEAALLAQSRSASGEDARAEEKVP